MVARSVSPPTTVIPRFLISSANEVENFKSSSVPDALSSSPNLPVGNKEYMCPAYVVSLTMKTLQ
jgi:hypothetical protein